MGEFSASLATVDALAGSGLLGVIFGLLFLVGAILVWLQLLVRGALLYILVVLAPLGFATPDLAPVAPLRLDPWGHSAEAPRARTPVEARRVRWAAVRYLRNNERRLPAPGARLPAQ